MMSKKWNEAKVKRFINDSIEESLILDYKAAEALAKIDGKRNEITKDVSAMANSAGGTIIYGLREFREPEKKHLAEAIDPVDRIQFSKEWLEHIINNIRPRLSGIIIYPISISTGANNVVYVVEIPQSHTAHQANDFRYYKRFNFESVPMADYEIRDVMSRAITPDADVDFRFRFSRSVGESRGYILLPIIKNLGTQVIKNFKLMFSFPRFMADQNPLRRGENIVVTVDENNDHIISYHSRGVLFPLEERDIGEEITWIYWVDRGIRDQMRMLELENRKVMILWTLYADNMTPKNGAIALQKLHD